MYLLYCSHPSVQDLSAQAPDWPLTHLQAVDLEAVYGQGLGFGVKGLGFRV